MDVCFSMPLDCSVKVTSIFLVELINWKKPASLLSYEV